MKRHKHKKKLGSIYAAAIAIGLTPEKAEELLRIKNANELRAVWDYRAFDMKIKDAHAALAAAASRQSYHRRKKENYEPYHFCSSILDYVAEKKVRDVNRESNLGKIASYSVAITLEEVIRFTNGLNCGYGCVVSLEENFLLIERKETETWNKEKSLKWPTYRHSIYSLQLISPAGDTIASDKLGTRNGDWLHKVGISLGLTTGDRTPITQTASMIPIREYNHLEFTIIEHRLFGIGFSSYCATTGNFHFHASTMREAITGLLRKIRAHELK